MPKLNMKKYIYPIIITALFLVGFSNFALASWYNPFSWFQETIQEIESKNLGAPSTELIYQKTILPITDSAYDLGTTTKAWRNTYFDQVCLTDDTCRTTWPTIGASPDWNKQTNYGVLNLTASTTIPYWAKDAFYASSTSVFQGLATFGNASTSQISAANSYLGNILSGAWNGTAISNQYGGTGLNSSALTGIAQIVAGTWSASSTLSTAFGGTGWNSIQANTVLLGNGSGRIATTSETGRAHA